jgi:hypothetical protein
MTTPTVTEIRRNGNPVGERIELARYTVPIGQRVLYGQRVNGVVRFLLGSNAVLVPPAGFSEDGTCGSRRQKRQNSACAPGGAPSDGREVWS